MSLSRPVPAVETATLSTCLGEVLLAATDAGLWEVVLPGLQPSPALFKAARLSEAPAHTSPTHTSPTHASRVRTSPTHASPTGADLPRSALRSSLARAHLETAQRELAAYFAGQLHRFTVAIDLRTGGFYRQVQLALAQIPYGGTETYGQLAARIGHPGAARAVGTSCATNPLPLILPCHRVVAAGGGLGGYAGGLEQKRRLLALEGTRLP